MRRLIAVVMPDQWMDLGHRALGMGPFPDEPIAEYLARSTSSLSAFYGGLVWALSTDVVRYAPIIRYQAIAMICLSTGGLIVGLVADVPMVWIAIDVAGCWLFCVPTLYLLSRLPKRDEMLAVD